MKNSHSKPKRLKGSFLAFLIVSLLFFAVGLGTVGSVYGTGNAYELTSKNSGEIEETPGVVFRLSNLTESDGKGGTKTTSLRLRAVWLHLGAIYAKPGTPAQFRLDRSTSGTTFSYGLDGVVENFFTETPVPDENGKTPTVLQPTATDGLYHFVSPFAIPEGGWRVSTYPYIRISLKTATPNVLLNEVVFVGEKLDSNYDGTGEMAVVPATVYAATPSVNEPTADAMRRAEALLDAQTMPNDAQSTFFRLSKDEIYAMATVSEMRLGSYYAADKYGVPVDTYTVDGVYGAFGTDFLALGTRIFGMSPFGLRVFPMLACFGALVVLARLIVKLTKKEEAGLVFAVLYALSAFTFGYGHFGTPLMIGIFFLACALSFAYRFYADGIRRADFVSALPLLLSGLFGAAAIAVNGAFLLPVLGVAGLFAAGMVRQQTAKRYHLEKAAAEDEASGSEPLEAAETETAEGAAPSPVRRTQQVLSEYRFKNRVATILFFAGLVFGAFLFSLVGMAPAYFTYLKAYYGPADTSANVFLLAWRTFANGFAGVNAYGAGNGWSLFNVIYTGSGAIHAVTALAVNPVVLLAGIAGLVYGVVRLVGLLRKEERDKIWRAEMRRTVILLAGLALSLVAAAVRTAAPFVVLAYLFGMLLAANFSTAEFTGKAQTAVRVAKIVGLVLLALCFVVLAPMTFSVPLPESIVGIL